MAINQYDYHKRCCPSCRSFNVTSVVLLNDFRRAVINDYRGTENHAPAISPSGFYCENCKRYHESHLVKCVYDRKAMQRDMLTLQRLLKKKKI